MKYIIKHLLQLIFFLFALYFVLAIFIYNIQAKYSYIDFRDLKTHQKALSNIQKLGRLNKTNIVFLGASMVGRGFRPDYLKNKLPTVEFHNLAMGNANITLMTQIIQLLKSSIPASSKMKPILVIGLWYGCFLENKNAFVDLDKDMTPLDSAMKKDNLLYKNENTIIKLLTNLKSHPRISFLFEPFITFDNFTKNIKANIKTNRNYIYSKNSNVIGIKKLKYLFLNSLTYSRPPEVATLITEEYKKEKIKYWQDRIKTDDGSILNNNPFEEFLVLCEIIKKAGWKLIIIDLPIPQWHSEQSKHFKYYQNKKKLFYQKVLEAKTVKYLDMQYLNKEELFLDQTHPSPKTSAIWSDIFVEYYKSLNW